MLSTGEPKGRASRPRRGAAERRCLRRPQAKDAATSFSCQFSCHMIISLSHRKGPGNERMDAVLVKQDRQRKRANAPQVTSASP